MLPILAYSGVPALSAGPSSATVQEAHRKDGSLTREIGRGALFASACLSSVSGRMLPRTIVPEQVKD